LTTLPGVGAIRASRYGAGIADPWRFPNAGAAYRASGLVPTEYDSAGKHRRRGQRISREGSVLLREAIIELGKGLTGHDEDFAAYRRRLIDIERKTPAVAAVAAGHRAHRLAFAMLRSGTAYDSARWRDAVLAAQPLSNNSRRRRPKPATANAQQPDRSSQQDLSRPNPRPRRQGPGPTSR
jgi:hypothetical protein